MRSLSISTHRFNRRKSTPNYHQHHRMNKSYSRQGSSAQLKLMRSRGALGGDRINNQQASQEEAYVTSGNVAPIWMTRTEKLTLTLTLRNSLRSPISPS